MTPEQLLHELRDQTYVMLRPSPIEGIGVFALRDIPKGCRDMFSPPRAMDDYVAVPRATIDDLPAHARRLVEHRLLRLADGCRRHHDHLFTKDDG